ncbi:MAG TPA: hypothetical protein VGC89_18055 [Pyrinomonadaceae bacterium]|jgi:hypothetical protein
MMKAVSLKMFLSFVGIVLVAPFFAAALIVGARAVALSQGTQDDLLLMALAFGGAVASIVNGLGRRMNKARRNEPSQSEAQGQREAIEASAISLGY